MAAPRCNPRCRYRWRAGARRRPNGWAAAQALVGWRQWPWMRPSHTLRRRCGARWPAALVGRSRVSCGPRFARDARLGQSAEQQAVDAPRFVDGGAYGVAREDLPQACGEVVVGLGAARLRICGRRWFGGAARGYVFPRCLRRAPGPVTPRRLVTSGWRVPRGRRRPSSRCGGGAPVPFYAARARLCPAWLACRVSARGFGACSVGAR